MKRKIEESEECSICGKPSETMFCKSCRACFCDECGSPELNLCNNCVGAEETGDLETAGTPVPSDSLGSFDEMSSGEEEVW